MFVLGWNAFSQPKDRESLVEWPGAWYNTSKQSNQALLIKFILGQSTSQYIVTHAYSIISEHILALKLHLDSFRIIRLTYCRDDIVSSEGSCEIILITMVTSFRLNYKLQVCMDCLGAWCREHHLTFMKFNLCNILKIPR